MSAQLEALARALGLVWCYYDGAGRKQTAPPDSIRAVCTAMGYPAGNRAEIAASLEQAETGKTLPDWLEVEADSPAFLELPEPSDWILHCEDGSILEIPVTTMPIFRSTYSRPGRAPAPI